MGRSGSAWRPRWCCCLRLPPAVHRPCHRHSQSSTGDTADKSRPDYRGVRDSLTAGQSASPKESYPAQLEQRLRAAGYAHRVINAGVGGDTTGDGLRRIDTVLVYRPAIVIVEFGANDGFQGVPFSQIRANLAEIIQRLQSANVRVVLAGMKLPSNYGPTYTDGLSAVYTDLAGKHDVVLIPFFLEGGAARPELNHSDGIHPTAEGYRIIVEHLWLILEPLLG